MNLPLRHSDLPIKRGQEWIFSSFLVLSISFAVSSPIHIHSRLFCFRFKASMVPKQILLVLRTPLCLSIRLEEILEIKSCGIFLLSVFVSLLLLLKVNEGVVFLSLILALFDSLKTFYFTRPQEVLKSKSCAIVRCSNFISIPLLILSSLINALSVYFQSTALDSFLSRDLLAKTFF